MILERSMSFDEIYVRNVCENLFKDFKIGIAYHIYSSASQSNCITKRSIPPSQTKHHTHPITWTLLPCLPYLTYLGTYSCPRCVGLAIPKEAQHKVA